MILDRDLVISNQSNWKGMNFLKNTNKIISILAGVVTFILFNVTFAPYSYPAFMPFLIGGGVYFAANTVLNTDEKKVKKIESKPEVKKIPKLKVDMLTDEMELKAMMDEAYKDLLQIRKGYMEAKHKSIQEKGEKLFNTGVNIFEHLRKNPAKIRQARRYLTYYLDTAANIMNKYIGFIETKLHDSELEDIYQKTDKALDILNEAFNKQFVKLLQNEMMDMDVDIKVLEDTLRTEG